MSFSPLIKKQKVDFFTFLFLFFLFSSFKDIQAHSKEDGEKPIYYHKILTV